MPKRTSARLVAQFDGQRFGFRQLLLIFAVDLQRGQAGLQFELIRLTERQTLDAEAIFGDAQCERRFGIELQIVLVLRRAGVIELAGEDETGFRFVAGGLNLKPAKREIRCGFFGV